MINSQEHMQERMAGRTATVIRALELARACLRAPAAGGVSAASPDTVSSELAHHLLPHLESDARLASAAPGTQGLSLHAELTGQRRELGQLVEELDRVLVDAVHRPRRGAARTLEAVVGLLERHLATERELWAALGCAGAPAEALSELSQDAEATERMAERSLRFVWHPPVASTAAKALWWTSPSTRRVVVLDAAGAAGIREAARGGVEMEAP